VGLFLAGSAAFRHALRIGPERYRLTAAAACLGASALGVTVSAAAEIALLTVIVAVSLAAERRGTLAAEDEVPAARGVWGAGPPGGTSVGA
jgi:hypothetical protein